ncbi:MAG: GNAT family N-acetyltransferase [Nevskiales bacterium]|nr:GNAT family N-acetyltransferase [Nevskiales bacterium]
MSERTAPSPPQPTLVTTWHLQMLDPAAHVHARQPDPAPVIERALRPSPAFSRFLYTAVGGHWYWRDRLGWSFARWQRHLDRPQLQTWVLYDQGSPGGYIELEQQAGAAVEIAYFGLLPECIGKGYGGYLLDFGIERAWAMGARRVWVHTCSLDGPHARANYEARGMTLFHTEQHEVDLPPAPPGPWPGWGRDDEGASAPAPGDVC